MQEGDVTRAIMRARWRSVAESCPGEGLVYVWTFCVGENKRTHLATRIKIQLIMNYNGESRKIYIYLMMRANQGQKFNLQISTSSLRAGLLSNIGKSAIIRRSGGIYTNSPWWWWWFIVHIINKSIEVSINIYRLFIRRPRCLDHSGSSHHHIWTENILPSVSCNQSKRYYE